MLTGRVIRFDDTRGFGFIAQENASGQQDVFLHVNGLVDGSSSVATGARVAFQVMQGQRGPKAYDVRVIGDDEAPPTDHASEQRPVPDLPEGDMCDVLTRAELTAELTELLLAEAPSLTGAQIVDVRAALLTLAKSHDWVID
ncbi:cold-shock protein [Lentzea sp.]|uniref:cold-shock protein n=1 Tax=Lentzea sp. TaxID=56099 RepID=UPI002CBDD382|nr:cold shock domain-containing protein [Lentzea sp.]HUQ57779.1 cold shock domain-containing protein [Lentzea sp.]